MITIASEKTSAKWFTVPKMALRSLRANLFRSALTLLGVVIGVAAVVTMLAIGNGSKQQVMQRIQSMGTNLLLVFPGAPGTRPSGDIATLVPADAQAIGELQKLFGSEYQPVRVWPSDGPDGWEWQEYPVDAPEPE